MLSVEYSFFFDLLCLGVGVGVAVVVLLLVGGWWGGGGWGGGGGGGAAAAAAAASGESWGVRGGGGLGLPLRTTADPFLDIFELSLVHS